MVSHSPSLQKFTDKSQGKFCYSDPEHEDPKGRLYAKGIVTAAEEKALLAIMETPAEKVAIKRLRVRSQEDHIRQERIPEIADFIWDADIVFEELGIPPIHSPWRTLNSLPPEVKEKMFLYHTAGLPPSAQGVATGLQFVDPGASHVLLSSDANGEYTGHRLQTALDAPIFRDLHKNHIVDLLYGSMIEKYAPGETIIHNGEPGDAMYILVEGRAELEIPLPDGSHKVIGDIYSWRTVRGIFPYRQQWFA